MLQLPVHAGAVSAFYFIVLDLLLLTLVDVSLAHSLSFAYHRRVASGNPVLARSKNIPGVTDFIIGHRLWLPNVAALLIKLAFLACILYLDLNIIADTKIPLVKVERDATYEFDPSEKEWPKSRRDDGTMRIVERRWAQIRECHVLNQNFSVSTHPSGSEDEKENEEEVKGKVVEKDEAIAYYALAFNLSEGKVVADEVAPLGTSTVAVDDNTLVCLDPASVEEPRTVAQVRGCSRTRQRDEESGDFIDVDEEEAGRCADVARAFIKLELPFTVEYHVGKMLLFEGVSTVTYSLFDFSLDVWAFAFKSYAIPSAHLTCSRTKYGLASLERRNITTGCLIVIPDHQTHSTLFEMWHYDEQRLGLTRMFAGPVFEGVYNVSLFQRANIVQNSFREQNWATLSSVILAEAMVYRRRPRAVTIRGARQSVTTIPRGAIIVAAVMVVVAVSMRVAVALSIGRDVRPQLNAINGLSSIAREEAMPTGRSVVRGDTLHVGFSLNEKGDLHFGPLKRLEFSVRPIKGVDIL